MQLHELHAMIFRWEALNLSMEQIRVDEQWAWGAVGEEGEGTGIGMQKVN